MYVHALGVTGMVLNIALLIKSDIGLAFYMISDRAFVKLVTYEYLLGDHFIVM